MSDTYKHKINGKFNNGLIDIKDIPMGVLRYWNRKNWLSGKFKSDRAELKAKIHLQSYDEPTAKEV